MTKQQKLAQEIVDRCTENPANQIEADLGRNIFEELKKVAPTEPEYTELFTYALQYMMYLTEHTCMDSEDSADHNCPMKNVNSN